MGDVLSRFARMATKRGCVLRTHASIMAAAPGKLEPEDRIHSKHGLGLPSAVVIGSDAPGEGSLVSKFRANGDQIGEAVRPPDGPTSERSVKP